MSENIAPVILTALDLEVNFGEQVILNKASLSIHEGDRIGLVGRNGVGKSTFLKIISDIMQPDSGEVSKKKDLVVSFLPQEFQLNNEKNVFGNIIEGAENILRLVGEYEKTSFDSPKRDILEQKINNVDGWNLEKHVDILMKSLSAPGKEREIYTLSGGEKRRVALCCALISQPDLLILDEPTNHLDTDSIEWIESFLANYKGTCIFVTHDRYFLDRISNRIVELSNGVFYSHQGNYTEYLISKSERQAMKEIEEKKRQSFLKRELEWIRRGPKARRTKAKSRIDSFNELTEIKNDDIELDVDLIIPEPEKLGNKILELKNISVELGGKMLIEGLSFAFDRNRKLGIVGPNGSGKTTLLRAILEEIKLYAGKIDIGERTSFNYVDQSRLILNDDDTVFNSITEGSEFITFGNRKLNVYTYLRRFLFTDDRINTLVSRLSGGERSRLTLARILKHGGNFLMLDEPTNDLDLPTLRILEEALLSFEGCVVVISHDRYFLNRVCNGILSFEGSGQVHFSEGNYDYYVEKRNSRLKEFDSLQVKEKKGDTRVKEKIRKLTWKENKELETIEETIMNAEEEVERIEKIFISPDFYEKYAEQTNVLNQQLNEAKENVKKLYERWEELESIKSLSSKK